MFPLLIKDFIMIKDKRVHVSKTDGYADVFIVVKATDLMKTSSKVVIVGDNTDLLILALHMRRCVSVLICFNLKYHQFFINLLSIMGTK